MSVLPGAYRRCQSFQTVSLAIMKSQEPFDCWNIWPKTQNNLYTNLELLQSLLSWAPVKISSSLDYFINGPEFTPPNEEYFASQIQRGQPGIVPLFGL